MIALESWKAKTQELHADDVEAAWEWMFNFEVPRRRDMRVAVNAAVQRENEIAESYYSANPPKTGESGHPVWAQPRGGYDAWPSGWTVEKDGVLFVNRLDTPNVNVPGSGDSGWALVDGSVGE